MKLLQLFLLLFAGSTVRAEVTCAFSNSSNGVCRERKYCAESSPICFIRGVVYFVCCRESAFIRARPSERYCDEEYEFGWPVVNGLATKPLEFPYMVALGWETRQPNVYDYKCGGAIISRNFIVTAAHCAYVDGRRPVVMLSGGVNLTDTSRQKRTILNVIVHPEYNPKAAYHDIALVEFEETNYYEACLWVKEEMFSKTVIAIGYGHTKFAGRASNQLLKANLDFVDQKECQEYYEGDDFVPRGILNTQLCAKDPTEFRDTCQGDSGGPIIMKRYEDGMERPYLVGITSFGQGCAHEPPGIYTRISSYIDWIEDIVWKNWQPSSWG